MAGYGELFWTFAKVGVMTFGGGYAMLPILQREVVENKGWATDQELADYFAVGQCTPGVIAVNTATFIGHKTRGSWGGIVATLGVIFPSLIIITLLAGVIQNFSGIKTVQSAFAGIRPRRDDFFFYEEAGSARPILQLPYRLKTKPRAAGRKPTPPMAALAQA